MIANVKKSKKEIELEVKKRIDHVVKLLNENNKISKQDIRTSTMNKFKVTEKQVDVYTVEAKKILGINEKSEKKSKPKNKEDIFCHEYIIEFNATKSAVKAGFSEKTARQQASRLLSNVNIQNQIKKLIKARKEKLHIDSEQVVNEVRKLGFSDIGDFLDCIEFNDKGVKFKDEVDTSLIKKITLTKSGKDITKATIELHSKEKALELLMKHLGILPDNLKISGDKDNPINIDLSKLNDEEIEKLIKLKEKCENGKS